MEQTMRALVYTAPGVLTLERREIPKIGEEDVLVRVKSCGICGSDISGYLGKTGRRIAPMIMGHEFSGEIAAVGNAVRGWQVGDRVTAQPIRFCGQCEFCRSGRTSLCTHQSMLGVLDTDGAMADYVRVWHRQLVPIPASVDFDTAALAEPYAVAYSAVNKIAAAGKNVAVVGSGTIGLMTLIALRAAGAKKIWAFDINPQKRACAIRFGADQALDPRDPEAHRRMLEETGGMDAAFEAVGADPSVATALDSLKKGGTAVWIGNMKPSITLNMQQVVTKELRIQGHFDYSQASFEAAVMHLEPSQFQAFLERTVTLERAAPAFAEMAAAGYAGLKTIIHIG